VKSSVVFVTVFLDRFRGLYIHIVENTTPQEGEGKISADVILEKKYENAKKKQGENVKEKGRKWEEKGRKGKENEKAKRPKWESTNDVSRKGKKYHFQKGRSE
jgi:hypothetical protein